MSWLDEGEDSDGEKYLEIRRRLVSYFARKRCLTPDELADEALTRVARRLEEEGAITEAPPARYCYIVAKFVFLEYLRRREHSEVSFEDFPDSAAAADDAGARREKLLDCLDDCLRKLAPDQRALISAYYRDEELRAAVSWLISLDLP